MTEERNSTEKEDSSGWGAESWREVGESFKSLGESLVAALRETWENEEVRQQLKKGVDAFAEAINRAVKEARESEHAKQAREEMSKAAQSAQEAGAQAFRDAKPHIMASIRQLSAELQKVLDRLEKEQKDGVDVAPPDDGEA